MQRIVERLLVVVAVAGILSCGAAGISEPSPDGTQFIFRNMGTLPIVSAGASTCDDMREWPNQLKQALAPGAQVTLDVYAECWNLQAMFQDGREKIQWDVKMTKGARYTWLIN